ncbi:MAG: hypothetical protein DRI84_05800 [Bacteroidetes bacterium]|nr:MAG: hypothetical protein DRI84_05800 [Bacteroidota bacterium]
MEEIDKHKSDFYKYRKAVFVIIAISFIIRAFFAYSFELGNDEVYYWLLAANPTLNYFDHPPMFAYFINLFSFGLAYDSEFFIRLSSLIIFSINTWIIFRIGKELLNARMGFIAVLLYQSSIYSFVITGIMIIPDTPLGLFWLLAMRSFLIALRSKHIAKREQRHMILAGIFIGLAIISKYQSVIFLAGAGVFIIISKREWLKKPQLYIAFLLSLLIILPILWTNFNSANSNISFQTDRVQVFGALTPIYFMREFIGQLVFNNPINVVIALVAIFSFRKKKFLKAHDFQILMWFGIPGILTFLFFSAFSATLPHWSAPAYFALMFISAAYLTQISHRRVPLAISFAIGLLLIILTAAYAQINYGLLYHNKEKDITNLGVNDLSLDLYGWNQIAEGFLEKSVAKHAETRTIIARKWYNAAHIDYYIAQPNQMKLIALSNISDNHEYTRINQLRGEIKKGENAWFISVSRNYQDPFVHFSYDFEKIEACDTIPVLRNNKVVEYAFVFYLQNHL